MKHKIGILCSCLVMMSYLAVSPVIADMAAEFSDVSISTIQIVITLPSLVCLATSLLAGALARRLYKRTIYMVETGLGTAQTAGLATSLNTFAGLLAGCLLSRIMARIRQFTVPTAFFLAVAGLLFTWLGGGITIILVGGALIGFGFSLYTPAGSCLVSEQVEGTGRSISLALLSACNNLGAALSPMIVNTLSGWFGSSVRVKFLTSAATLLIITIAAGAWLRPKNG